MIIMNFLLTHFPLNFTTCTWNDIKIIIIRIRNTHNQYVFMLYVTLNIYILHLLNKTIIKGLKLKIMYDAKNNNSNEQKYVWKNIK